MNKENVVKSKGKAEDSGSSVRSTLPVEPKFSSLKDRGVGFFLLSIALVLVAVALIIPGIGSRQQLVLPAILLTAALLLVTLVSGAIFFQRRIIRPLWRIESSLKNMIDGNLSKPISLENDDELGQVATRINELAMNTQDILLCLWNHTQQNSALLEQLNEQMRKEPETMPPQEQLQNYFFLFHRQNEELQSLVHSFDYFEVKLENDKVLSDTSSKYDCTGH